VNVDDTVWVETVHVPVGLQDLVGVEEGDAGRVSVLGVRERSEPVQLRVRDGRDAEAVFPWLRVLVGVSVRLGLVQLWTPVADAVGVSVKVCVGASEPVGVGEALGGVGVGERVTVGRDGVAVPVGVLLPVPGLAVNEWLAD